MRTGIRIRPLCFVFLFILSGVIAARAQTDVAASLYGAFNGSTRGNRVINSASNSAGALFEVRHISNPLSGYGVAYSYHRANQAYAQDCSTTASCGTVSPASVSANAHQLDLDWLASIRLATVRPFALAGAGLLLNHPAGGQTQTIASNRMVFLYGLGIDLDLLPHSGLRVQYRRNLYKAPGVTQIYSSTGSFTYTADIGIGYYIRF